MRSNAVVIVRIVFQNPTQMFLAQDNDVVQTLAPDRSDQPLGKAILPNVLFRRGEEKEARKYIIDRGWLEAVVGLPAGLFYGTPIPACILVMNKKDAAKRKHIL